MSQVEFTDTVSRSGALKPPTLLGCTYATVRKLTFCMVQCVIELVVFPFSKKQLPIWCNSLQYLRFSPNNHTSICTKTVTSQWGLPVWCTWTRNFREDGLAEKVYWFAFSFLGLHDTGLFHVMLCLKHYLPITIYGN